jgi:hypothetical protein
VKNRAVITSALAALLAAVTLGACGEAAPEELTATKPYSDLVGREYLVLADDLQAFGLAGGWPDRTVTSITLETGDEFRGHQVAFRRQVPKGKVLRILSAWRQRKPFGGAVYYLVSVAGTDLPPGVPIQVPPAEGNVTAELNPALYRRLPGHTAR